MMPYFLFIALLTAFPALSTDMYLPALPTIQQDFGEPLALVNLSLVLFFVVFSTSLLVHGSLSDRFGRKPVLLTGIAIYVLASVGCAVAADVWMLITARCVQGFGAAAASSLSLALAKDLYDGDIRKKVFAYLGVMMPLCPMIAPYLGSLVLEYTTWRWIFFLQAIATACVFVRAWYFPEPEIARTTGGVWQVMGRYVAVLRNTRFSFYCFAFSFMGVGFFAFLAGSSDIYIRIFALSEQEYAMFFAINALGFMSGSFVCARFCVGFSSTKILRLSLFGVLGSNCAVWQWGDTAVGFAATMALATFFLGMSRPISNHMVLETVETDIGTASSILTFTYFILGAAAMQFISFDWSQKTAVVGLMGMFSALIPLAALLYIRDKYRT